MRFLHLVALPLAAALASPCPAQIDRESSALVDYVHLRHAALTDVQSWSAQGFRLSNLEVSQPNPMQLNCSMVRNTGPYAAGWLFHFDKTRAQLLDICNNSNARIVDLERYEVNGQERLAALLFVNTGAQQKAWHWHTGIAQGSVYSTINGLGARVIDLEPYMDGATRRYHVISIANTGADQKPWWVYTDTDVAGVQGYMAQHDARLYDFELQSLIPSSVACVLVRDSVKSTTVWGQFYGSGFDLDHEYGGRVVGLAQQSIGSYAITMVDNFDPFLTVGFGCEGTNGVTTLTGEGTGFTGTQVTNRAQNLRPWAPTFVVYGLTPQYLNLGPMGAPGCWGFLVPIATELKFANGSGIATDVLSIPGGSGLAGLSLLSQMLAMDPGNNALGLQASNALRTRIRHW